MPHASHSALAPISHDFTHSTPRGMCLKAHLGLCMRNQICSQMVRTTQVATQSEKIQRTEPIAKTWRHRALVIGMAPAFGLYLIFVRIG